MLVKILRQAISDLSSTRKRTARSNLFRAFSYQHRLFRYTPLPPQNFKNKRKELQAAKRKFLTLTTDRAWDLSCWRGPPISSVAFTARDSSHPFFPSHTQVSDIESDASGSSLPQDHVVLFRHNAGTALYQALIGFDPVLESTSVNGTVLF